MSRQQPRGIRNNNPGNIEWGSPWQGLVPEDQRTDERFCQFLTPADGIRAIARTLITYQDKRKAKDGSRIDSILEVIERWAPPSDNNPTESYARGIAQLIDGVEYDDEVIDMQNYEHIRPIVEGIIRHECGRGPLNNVNTWYPDEVIDEALRRAGIVRRQSVSIAKESAVPATVAVAGATQVAEVLPDVVNAMRDAEANLNSGNTVQIIVGVATIVIAGYIAYQRYKAIKAGSA